MIKLSKFKKYYNKGKRNETCVFENLDLEFENTGLVCILGESGCGKTTLLNSIGGLDSFESGTIQIDDETVNKYKMKQIERIRNDKYGYIFQNYYLLSDQSVEDNIMIALSMFSLSEEEKQARVDYTLEAMGLSKYKKKKVSNLSGGQQQRVSIARALVKAPEIILADEPTGNLDEENTLNTMSILKSISKQCLVILVTHERDMAKLFADRIIEMVDGKIEADYPNKSTDSYVKSDDQNIYLGEYEEVKLQNDLLELKMYNATENDKKLKLTFVFKDGKLYIKNESNTEIFIEEADSDFSIIDGKAPKLKLENMEDMHFELEDIKSKNTNKLPFSQLRKIAKENRKALGKRQSFMIITVLVATIMLTLVVADYINKKQIDKSKIITSDSHLIGITFTSAGTHTRRREYQELKERYCEAYGVSTDKYAIIHKITPKANFVYDDIAQLSNVKKQFDSNCFVSLDLIEDKSIVYGRRSETPDEIVVDKMVLDKFKADNPVIGGQFEDYEDFLGREIILYADGNSREIVGITDVDEPDIFVDERQERALSAKNFVFASLSEFKSAYPGKYDDLELSEDETYMLKTSFEEEFPHSREQYKIAYADNWQYGYVVKDTIDENYYADAIISDEQFEKLAVYMLADRSGFNIYVYDTDDIDDVISHFQDLLNTGEYKGKLKIETTYTYDDEIKAYLKETQMDANARNIATIVVFGLSIIVVYFSMKLNISARKEQIIVYRLIGINPGSIIKSFVMEMGSLTAVICIPAIAVTGFVMNFVSNLEVLQIHYYFSWVGMLLLALAMIIANVLVCFISVNGMLRRPPVQL